MREKISYMAEMLKENHKEEVGKEMDMETWTPSVVTFDNSSLHELGTRK